MKVKIFKFTQLDATNFSKIEEEINAFCAKVSFLGMTQSSSGTYTYITIAYRAD